jgi:hypothetical protein
MAKYMYFVARHDGRTRQNAMSVICSSDATLQKAQHDPECRISKFGLAAHS